MPPLKFSTSLLLLYVSLSFGFGFGLVRMSHILVTGANKGIGYGICEKILSQAPEDCKVILAARDEQKGIEATTKLRKEFGLNRISFLKMDVSSDESVEAAISELMDQEVELDVLVNNAGIARDVPWAPKPFTADIARDTLNTNLLGVIRVSEKLVPLMKSSGGRIVNITSGAGQQNAQKMSAAKRAQLLRDDLSVEDLLGLAEEFVGAYEAAAALAAGGGRGGGEGDLPRACAATGHWLQAYGFSKACLNALTRCQARAWPHLAVNCCTPGFVATDMVTRNGGGYAGETPLKTWAEGADTPVWLALGNDVPGTGELFGNGRQRLSPEEAYGAPISLQPAGERRSGEAGPTPSS